MVDVVEPLHLSRSAPSLSPPLNRVYAPTCPPPSGIAKEAFFGLWKSFTGPPNKAQEMVERAPGSAPLSIEATLALLRGLGFGVEHQYLDPSPHNEAGAAQFWFGQPGAEQSALAQVSAKFLHVKWCGCMELVQAMAVHALFLSGVY